MIDADSKLIPAPDSSSGPTLLTKYGLKDGGFLHIQNQRFLNQRFLNFFEENL